jgi:hypothetical protein
MESVSRETRTSRNHDCMEDFSVQIRILKKAKRPQATRAFRSLGMNSDCLLCDKSVHSLGKNPHSITGLRSYLMTYFVQVHVLINAQLSGVMFAHLNFNSINN